MLLKYFIKSINIYTNKGNNMNSKFYKELADELKVARKLSGLSQEQTAEKTKFERSSIANYEQGRRNIDLEFFFKLCKIYNTDGIEILKRVSKVLDYEESTENNSEESEFSEELKADIIKRYKEMVDFWDVELGISNPTNKEKEQILDYVNYIKSKRK